MAGRTTSTAPDSGSRNLRVLFYALGGGYGHVQRTLNIVRSLRRRVDLEPVVMCPRRCLSLVKRWSKGEAAPGREREVLARWWQERLERFAPDLVVVDTFPRGVLGELRLSDAVPSVLVTRTVNPAYYSSPGVLEACHSYHRVIWTEPRTDPAFPGTDAPPVLDPRSLISRDRARRMLGYDGRPVVLVVGSGARPAQIRFRDSLRTLEVSTAWKLLWFSPDWDGAVPDLGLLLKGADLVIAAAGYNTYYEIARAGVPAILVPQPRKVDNQWLRAKGLLPYSTKAPARVLEEEQAVRPEVLRLHIQEMLQERAVNGLAPDRRAVWQQLLEVGLVAA